MKKQVLFTILMLLPIMMTGFPVKINGIYYNLLDNNYAQVTKESDYYYKGNVVIPENINYNGVNYTVTSIGDDAFQSCSGLTSITIPNSVTSIGKRAFEVCKGLTSIKIPNSVTSIGTRAFYGCTNLAEIIIPISVNSIEEYAFENTVWFNSIEDGLIYINDIAYCYKGKTQDNTSLKIKEGTTTIANRAFAGCSGLTSIEIPNSVISIGQYAFSECSGLTSIEIPSSVSNISDFVFRGCSSLTSITIPNSVTIIGPCAFVGCSGLTSIEIPNSVTSIDSYAFFQCSGLSSVTIPNSVTSIGDGVFMDCTGLTSVELGMPNHGGSVFLGCSNLTKMILHGMSVSLSWLDQKAKNNDETSNIKEQIKEIVIGDDVNSINSSAFSGFKNLISINIPSSVTSIGRSAFYGCTGLTTIDIPESVTSIGAGAFADCTNLSSINFPENIDIGSGAFNNTAWFNSLEDGLIYFGNTLYQYKGIMPENTTITIEEGTTSIHALAFDGCRGLCSITIPSSVTYIGSSAFASCSGLTSIVIPGKITIEYDSFSGCENLNSIYIDDLISWIANEDKSGQSILGVNLLRNIKDCHLYLGDKEITNLKIPTELVKIPGYAFFNCTGIVSVDIPEGVTSIGQNAFSGCTQLKSMTIHCNRPPSANNYITSQEVFDNCVLYVPVGSENAYYVADGWKNFKTIKTIAAEEKVIQDVNDDGIVDTQDVLSIYRFMQQFDGTIPVDGYDVNGDGIVDTQDVLEIYKYIQEH